MDSKILYLTSAGMSQLNEDTVTKPSDEEKMLLMQWKFWVEGVLIPAVGLPGVCGRIFNVHIFRHIKLLKIIDGFIPVLIKICEIIRNRS